jgi:ABC-type antimicrobial peptide transport system permease subunit
VVSRSIASERSILVLLGLFAGLALLLTAGGIWGTMTYLLSQRRREIGIRLALGATDRAIVREVVRRAMKLVAAGLGVGLVVSVAMTRITSTKLFAVSLADPLTYAAVAILLAAVAWAANYCPAVHTTGAASYSILREE